jgi:hypothetical protein
MDPFRITSVANQFGTRFFTIYELTTNGYKVFYRNQTLSGMLYHLKKYPIAEQYFNSFIDTNYPKIIIPMRGVVIQTFSSYLRIPLLNQVCV